MKEGLLKTTAFQALRLSGLLALAEARAAGVPILAYHGVTGDHSPPPLANRRRLHVPRARFAEHLRLIASQRQPIPLSRLWTCLARNCALPRRAVVVTFDDGYRNVLTQALPLLREHGVPATVFVVTGDGPLPFWQDRLEAAVEASQRSTLEWDGRVLPLATPAGRECAAATVMAALDALAASERESALQRLIANLGGPGRCDTDDRRRLDWDEVRALRDAGVEIGSHAGAHEPLTSSGAAGVDAALVDSRRALGRELGAGPFALSYPYGARSVEIADAARAAGFACALTGEPRLVRPGDDPFHLARFLVGADDDLVRLRASLSGLRGRWQRDPWPPRA